MDGFIVVRLLANTTFNGSFSSLKEPDIDEVYTILDPKGGGGIGRPHIIPIGVGGEKYVESPGTWTRFTGAWTLVLFTSVAWWPLLALLVCVARKWVIDRQHAARVNPARALTPPLGEHGFELQPVVGGAGPAPPLPAPVQAVGQPLQDWEPSITERIVVLFWLTVWRLIQLVIMLEMMIFQGRLLPWLWSTDMRKCMASRWKGMYLPAWSIVFIIFTSLLFLLQVVQLWFVIACMVDKWMSRRVHNIGFVGIPLSPNLKFIFGGCSIVAMAFAMCSHYFRGCASVDMFEDLKMFSYALIPLWGWAIVDFASRPIERHYQKYWGFPTAD